MESKLTPGELITTKRSGLRRDGVYYARKHDTESRSLVAVAPGTIGLYLGQYGSALPGLFNLGGTRNANKTSGRPEVARE